MRRPLALVATFAVVLAVVLGAAALAPVVTGETRQSMPGVENPQYTDEDLLADRSPGQADVAMDADATNQTIVIDPGIDPEPRRPGPRVLFGALGPETAEREVLPLVNVLVENGHNVRVYTPPEDRERRSGPPRPGAEGERLSPLGEELADADAFVTFRTDYSDDEMDDLRAFTEEDGRVVVAREPDDAFEQSGGLASKSALGVSVEPGYVYNLEKNDLNYQRIFAESAGESAVTAGVDRAVFPTASPVDVAGNSDSELVPTEGAELSTTRAETRAPVLIQRGNVVVVGDTDFLVPENAQRADNDVLIGNLADFLVTNDRDPSEQAPNPPEDEGRERPERPPRSGGPDGPSDNETDRPPGPEPTPAAQDG
jgi:hypothetical protein